MRRIGARSAGPRRISPSPTPLQVQRLDERPLPERGAEIRLFGCFRNEALRLPAFLAHYRALGVERFFLVDDRSDDGSAEYLLQQPDVHLFRGDGTFAQARSGLRWLERLLRAHGVGGWCVCVDADEFLVYPDCERRSLREVAAYCDSEGHGALFSLLLDMYARAPIRSVDYRPGDDPREHCPHFDPDSHTPGGRNSRGYPTAAHRAAGLDHYRGGMRRRVFGLDLCLNKIPFFRYRPALRFTRGLHFVAGTRVAPLTGASLHFKYFSDFPAAVDAAIARRQHWQQGASYRVYAQALERDPDLSPWYAGSATYRSSATLVDCGILRTCAAWDDAPGVTEAAALRRGAGRRSR